MREITTQPTNVHISKESEAEFRAYLEDIKRNPSIMGARLAHLLKDSDIAQLNLDALIDALMRTWSVGVAVKHSAESSDGIAGAGRDWTDREISLSSRLGYVLEDLQVSARRTLPFEHLGVGDRLSEQEREAQALLC